MSPNHLIQKISYFLSKVHTILKGICNNSANTIIIPFHFDLWKKKCSKYSKRQAETGRKREIPPSTEAQRWWSSYFELTHIHESLAYWHWGLILNLFCLGFSILDFPSLLLPTCHPPPIQETVSIPLDSLTSWCHVYLYLFFSLSRLQASAWHTVLPKPTLHLVPVHNYLFPILHLLYSALKTLDLSLLLYSPIRQALKSDSWVLIWIPPVTLCMTLGKSLNLRITSRFLHLQNESNNYPFLI